MNKKRLILVLAFAMVFSSLMLVSVSAICNLDVTLINQDPDPAIPGEYVEVVFQMSGVENSECGGAIFKIIPGYPFSLDESASPVRELKGHTYVPGYTKVWNIPYNLRIDTDAIKGENKISVKYGSKEINGVQFVEDFNITVEDLRVDFIVSIKDYDADNQEITFEILNLGENDIEALTIDIPPQENFVHRGASRNIVGDLDSNEDTTFTFKAEARRGNINLEISYTDGINERRSLNKTAFFEPDYFEKKENGYSISFYLLVILIILLILNYIMKKLKKRRKRQSRRD